MTVSPACAADVPVERSLARLPGLLDAVVGAPRPRMALVCGRVVDRPWAAQLSEALAPHDPAVVPVAGTATPEAVAAVIAELRAVRAEVVVAVGGGTVLDVAKAAAALVDEPGPWPAERVAAACAAGSPPPCSGRPVIAVPTTPGSGAEVTPFATLWTSRSKLSLSGPALAPRAAVLDPTLLVGLPRTVLVGGLLDALSQGAEATWSVRSTAAARRLGLDAVHGAAEVAEDLLRSTTAPAPPVLARLQLAGHRSGHAIALTPTSSAHALSYGLTLREGLAHGHACGLALARLLPFNAQAPDTEIVDPRGPAHARRAVRAVVAAAGARHVDALVDRIERLIRSAGLRWWDAVSTDPAQLATDALGYPRSADNPRRLDAAALGAAIGPTFREDVA